MPSHVISIEEGISTSRPWVNIEHFFRQDCLLEGFWAAGTVDMPNACDAQRHMLTLKGGRLAAPGAGYLAADRQASRAQRPTDWL